MPVNYTPQFIPTNAQALQGTLGEYQKAYDTETARRNQVVDLYSAIPTTNNVDTLAKQDIMKNFTDQKLAELDKKYNYDRANSQYANELAREITGLRSNPLWSVIQQKEDINKMRQQLIANKGADYIENFNPLDITVAERDKLTQWKPGDLNEVRKTAALAAKEYATSYRPELSKETRANGVITYVDQYGSPTTEHALSYLNSKAGQDALDKSIIASGYDPNDPRVRQAAHDTMLSNLVGENKISRDTDYEYIAGLKADATKDRPSSWIKRDNIGITEKSNIRRFSDAEAVNEELQTIESKPVQTPADKQRKAQLQATLKDTRSKYNTEASKPGNKTILETGLNIVKNGVKDPAIDPNVVFKELEKYYVYTTGVERTAIGSGAKDLYSNVLKPVAVVAADIAKLVTNSYIMTIPFVRKGGAKERIRESIDGIISQSMAEDVTIDDNSKARIAAELTAKTIINKYGNTKDIDENTLKQEWATLYPQFLSTTKEFGDYYKGRNQYYNTGYYKFEDSLNRSIKSGETRVADVYDAPMDWGPADYTRFTGTIERNLNSFDVYQDGDNTPLSQDKVKAIIGKINAAAGKDGNISVQAAFDRESEPRLLTTLPSGDKIELRMNLDRMGEQTALELYQETGRPEFMDGIYKDIKIEDGTYTLNDKDQYLNNIISQRYRDLTPFRGMELTNQGGVYTLMHPKLTEASGKPSVDINSKFVLMSTLDEIYRDYLDSKK